MKFKTIFLMMFALVFSTMSFSQERVPVRSVTTGATIGYEVNTIDTIPTDTIPTATVEALFQQSTPNSADLLTELSETRAELNSVNAALGQSTSETVACQEQYTALQEQNNSILEAVGVLTEALAEQTPNSYSFGLGVGYYTTETFDVTGQFYLGQSLISASWIFDDETDQSFRVGLGQQLTNQFTVVAQGTFNRVNDEFQDTSYGLDVQYRFLGNLAGSVGVDTNREIRVGVLYNL